jgi:hypothetical protein
MLGFVAINHRNESTDSIRTILADEIKRAAARAEYFDQQQGILLQRHESLSKESSDVIKTLVQKPVSGCDGKKPKDINVGGFKVERWGIDGPDCALA